MSFIGHDRSQVPSGFWHSYQFIYCTIWLLCSPLQHFALIPSLLQVILDIFM